MFIQIAAGFIASFLFLILPAVMLGAGGYFLAYFINRKAHFKQKRTRMFVYFFLICIFEVGGTIYFNYLPDKSAIFYLMITLFTAIISGVGTLVFLASMLAGSLVGKFQKKS